MFFFYESNILLVLMYIYIQSTRSSCIFCTYKLPLQVYLLYEILSMVSEVYKNYVCIMADDEEKRVQKRRWHSLAPSDIALSLSFMGVFDKREGFQPGNPQKLPTQRVSGSLSNQETFQQVFLSVDSNIVAIHSSKINR